MPSWWPGLDLAELGVRAAAGVAVSLLFAAAAYRLHAVDRSGAVAGSLLATAILVSLGWRGFVLLALFVALGTAATRLGYRLKERARLAQGRGGRRSARHAVANAGVAALAAVLTATTPHAAILTVAFTAALATATGDTLSSEVGQLRALAGGRGRTVSILTWRPVRPGTDGGVSAAGSVAGVAGSLAVAVAGFALGLYPAAGVAVVLAAGVWGNLLDSFLGATLERRGLLDNEGVNFASTLGGALAAIALARAL